MNSAPSFGSFLFVNRFIFRASVVAVLFISVWNPLEYSFAEDAPATAAAPEKKTVPKKPKGRIYREKEAEGTQAPNRFGSDVTVKSKYELNGQPLEVDTD